MEFDISQLFTEDTADTVVCLLEGDDYCKNTGLMMLSNAFLHGDPSTLSCYPLGKIIEILSKIMSECKDLAVLESTSNCIYSFFDTMPTLSVRWYNDSLLHFLNTNIADFLSYDSFLNCLKIINTILDIEPERVFSSILSQNICKNLSKLRTIDKKFALRVFQKVTCEASTKEYFSSIPYLISFIGDSDSTVYYYAVRIINDIFKVIEPSSFDGIWLQKLISSTNNCEDPNLIVALLNALLSASKNSISGDFIALSNLNFHRLFFGSDFKGKTVEVRRLSLNIITNLLPDHDLPADYWYPNNFSIPHQHEFAVKILPLIVEMILSKNGWETLTLSALASILLIEPYEFSDNLIFAIGGLSQNSLYVPFVVLVLLAYKDITISQKNGSLEYIYKYEPEPLLKDWFDKKLVIIKERIGEIQISNPYESVSFSSIHDIFHFLSNSHISSFEFQKYGLLKKAYETITNTSSNDCVTTNENIELLFKLVHGVLTFAPFPFIRDVLSGYSSASLIGKSVGIDVKTPEDENPDISLGLVLYLGGLGIWADLKANLYTIQDVHAYLTTCKYKDVVKYPVLNGLHLTLIYNFIKATDFAPRRKQHYVIDNKYSFSADNDIFNSLLRSLKHPSSFLSGDRHRIDFVDGDIPKPTISVNYDLPEVSLEALKFLERLHELYPEFNMVIPEYDRFIISKLSSLLLTSGFFSSESKIVYHYPFLFSPSTRQALFCISGSDMLTGLSYIEQRFNQSILNGINSEIRVKCCIRRSHIWEDGNLLIEAIGRTPIQWDLYFADEEGIGSGPTQEFLSLYSKELSRAIRNIWRNDNPSSEYAWSHSGLFPSPYADSTLFYWLGVLCAKVIQMGRIIPIPLSLQFIKRLLGKEVLIDDVDPVLANSLRTPEGLIGLPFSYPLYDIPIKEGDIDETNVSNYVEQIKSITTNLDEICIKFRDGFSTVIAWEMTKILTAQELLTLITGESVVFTGQEFRDSIIASHGYSIDSPQITMMFEIIDEMSSEYKEKLIRFITGSPRLPVGGLQSISPRLTIAMRYVEGNEMTDSTLPTVMTCTNYLKIPAYSTKQIMKEKLFKAIEMCQTTFQFT